MKTLKLEVGKTYRSRSGEEVKIVGKTNASWHLYQGSNGRWYTEAGQWCNAESPHDLIKEVEETQHTFAIVDEALTATRYTFDIPEGVKKVTAKQEGNRIIVEMVPEAKGPKPGDVMIDNKGNVYIFKSVVQSDIHKHFAWFGKDGRLVIGSMCTPGRPATPEEAQPLWDVLKKAGKRWNPETMQVEDVPEIERILEWVEANLKSDLYAKGDVAEAIESYLKHKEGKK